MEPEAAKPEADKPEGRHCKYYVKRKNRYCKFELVEGADYCRIHDQSQDRVACPYERDTYVVAGQLQKHLKVCPKFKQQQLKENSEWYEKSINKVGGGCAEEQFNIKQLYTERNLEFLALLAKLPRVFFEAFSTDPKGAYYYINLVEKHFDIQEENCHTLQGSQLTDLAKQYKLLQPDSIFVEFGAGKGLLSYTLHNELKKQYPKEHPKHILLEREVRRNKFDKYLKDNPFFQRFRGDVEDFNLADSQNIMLNWIRNNKRFQKADMAALEKELKEVKGLVGVCKHMCGKATDLSIAALQQASKKFSIRGTVMATCCHQLCSVGGFDGLDIFEKLGLNKQEIEWVFRVSSWGTRHTPSTLYTFQSKQEQLVEDLSKQARQATLNQQQREMLGMMCKRLIDRARCSILQKMGLNVQQVRYCEPATSPENFAIVSYCE